MLHHLQPQCEIPATAWSAIQEVDPISPGCVMPTGHDQTGHTLLADYDTLVNNNAGCGVADSRVKVWSRNDNPPSEFRSSDGQINTDARVN